jgi:DNA-binding NarL/FixJ family response regulator
VLDGGVFVSDEMTDRVLMSMASGGKNQIGASPLEVLSDRELEVFELIGRGFGTSEIAERMHIGVKTVGSYRRRIKDKLNLEGGSELTRQAVQWVESE